MSDQITDPKLDTSSAGRKIWLVKVPHFVAKRWRGVCDQPEQTEGAAGPVLGTLRIPANATDSSGQATFNLTLNNPATADLPQDYNLRTAATTGPAMFAFAETRGKLSSQGVVQHRLDAEPQSKGGAAGGSLASDPAYRKLSRERHQAASTKTRTIQMMTGGKFTDIRKPLGAEPVGAKRKMEQKRTAMPVEDLQPALFKMFERQTRWSFVQLQRDTEQPTQHLKAVLSEIAMQNKVGPYRDLWELKRQYRTGGGDGQGGAPGGV